MSYPSRTFILSDGSTATLTRIPGGYNLEETFSWGATATTIMTTTTWVREYRDNSLREGYRLVCDPAPRGKQLSYVGFKL